MLRFIRININVNCIICKFSSSDYFCFNIIVRYNTILIIPNNYFSCCRITCRQNKSIQSTTVIGTVVFCENINYKRCTCRSRTAGNQLCNFFPDIIQVSLDKPTICGAHIVPKRFINLSKLSKII